jgi:hypothetical protein
VVFISTLPICWADFNPLHYIAKKVYDKKRRKQNVVLAIGYTGLVGDVA